MTSESGWTLLLKLCCDDVESESEYITVQNEPTLLKYFIIKKLATYFTVSRYWEKCWALCQLEVKCNRERLDRDLSYETAFNHHCRRALTPSIQDVIDACKSNPNMTEAMQDMLEISKLATPPHVRLPNCIPGHLEYKEPLFEPNYHRHVMITRLIFHCIIELQNKELCDEILPSLEAILDRLLFYQKLFATFMYEFWPNYLRDELEICADSCNSLKVVFSNLLKLELDDPKTCCPDLIKLFKF